MRADLERTRRAAYAMLLCAAAACGDGPAEPPPLTTVDLNRLFAPPTAAELAAVQTDWAARTPGAADVRIEESQLLPIGTGAMQLRVVSHIVDDNRHYGAVLSPQRSSDRLPLLLYLHGGDAGVAVEEVVLVAAASALDPTRFVWVIPSFRSESLRLGARSWTSEGSPSPWDRDVDDVLALLDVAAGLVPGADRGCVGSIGLSRGGGVGLLLSARDARVRATVEFFGPTDFFSPFARQLAEEALHGQPRSLPGLMHLNQAWLQPLRRGEVSYDETRLALLRRSAARFAARLGPVQVHHGTADDVVPVDQAQALIDAMAAIGRGPPAFEAFIYTGAGHNPLTMIGAPDRVERFLGALQTSCPGAGSASYVAAPRPLRDQVIAPTSAPAAIESMIRFSVGLGRMAAAARS